MNIKFTFLAATIAAASLPALAQPQAQAPDLSKLPPASTQQGVTYAKDIKPIFEASCFNCHKTGGQRGPSHGVALDSLEGVLKGGQDGDVIKPGKSAESELVLAVARLESNPRMNMPPPPRAPRRGGPGGPGGMTNAPAGGATPPPGGAAGGPGRGPAPKNLTPEEVGLVRAWIDQGAK